MDLADAKPDGGSGIEVPDSEAPKADWVAFQQLVLAELERQGAAIIALRDDVRAAFKADLAEYITRLETKLEALAVLVVSPPSNIDQLHQLLDQIRDRG